MVSREETRRKVNCDHSLREIVGAFSQDFEDETGGHNGKVLEGGDNGRWAQGRGGTENYKVKIIPEMLTSGAVPKENRNEIQGGINWLQVLKNYFQ